MGTQRPRHRVRNFTSIADHEAAKTGLTAFPQFEGKGIRRTFHEGEWYFAVADIAVALTDTLTHPTISKSCVSTVRK